MPHDSHGIRHIASCAQSNLLANTHAPLVIEQMRAARPRHIGFLGMGYLPAAAYAALLAAFPDAVFSDATELIAPIKAVKSDEELERMRAAAELHDRAIDVARRTVRAGITAQDVIEEVRHFVGKAGSRTQSLMAGSAPPGTPCRYAGPAERRIEAGDQFAMLTECSAADGYYSEAMPTICLGERRHYTPAEAASLLQGVDVGVFTIRHDCTRELMAAAPRLRAVCYPTTGVESADLDAASELGVLVAHGATPGNVIGLAEATLMLMLALLYDLHGAERRLRQGQPKPAYPTARALHGKTVGFIGFGRIAQAMAERLLPFGVPMLACSRRPPPPTPGVRAVDLDTLLRESDVVCVLVTLNRDSRGMLGERELALMKPTAHLVNTGRGEAIDEAALYRALRERRIASAALDTFAVEPLPADSPLRTLDNVILTPHMVGQTREAADEFGPILVDNIRRLLRGELPRYCKNPEIAPRWRQRFGTPAGT